MNINVAFIRLDSGAALLAGAEDCRLSAKIVVTLVGPPVSGSEIASGVGSKGIVAMHGSRLELHGVSPAVVFTHLAATANAGATTLITQVPTGWAVGSLLAIAPTDFGVRAMDQSESVTITAISGTSIAFTPALSFMHFSAGYERAEVALLTRNIVIQGDAQSTSSGFGGHLMVRMAVGQFSAVEFTRMGQRSVLGRYPIHFHFSEDASASYVRHVTLHNNFQRCIVMHDTQNLVVHANVAYRTEGHCIFLEEGGETGNVITHNLVISGTVASLVPTDSEPAGLWLTNPDNTVEHNVVAGFTHGIWYSLPERPIGASASKYAADAITWPRQTPIRSCKHNVVHSNLNGLFVDLGPNADTGVAEVTQFLPRDPPRSAGFFPISLVLPSRIIGTLAWKNARHGIWTRGYKHIVSDSILVDNLNGVDLVGGFNVLRDSTVYAETANVGHITTPAETAAGRSLARPHCEYCSKIAVEWYDFGGPQYAVNVTVFGFTSTALRPAAAIGQLYCSRNAHTASNKLRDMHLVDSQALWLAKCGEKENPKNLAFQDVDGSLVGIVGAWIVGPDPVLTANIPATAGCTSQPTWGHAFTLGAGPPPYYYSDATGEYAPLVCAPFFEGMVNVVIVNKDTAATDFGTTVSASEPVRGTWYALSNGASTTTTGEDADRPVRDSYKRNMAGRNMYAFKFAHNTPPHVEVHLFNQQVGDWIVIALPYPAAAAPLTIRWHIEAAVLPSASSRESLSERTPWFHDTAAGWLYLYVSERAARAVDAYGFNDGEYSINLSVLASCGTSCTVPAGIPSSFAFAQHAYEGLLQSCQAGTASAASGRAFFSYRPDTHWLSWNVIASLGERVSSATVRRLADDSLAFALPGLGMPIKGGRTISHALLTDLYAGRLYVSLATTAHPSGELRARLGCVGTCAAPPALLTDAGPCLFTGDVQHVAFGEALGPGWADVSSAGVVVDFAAGGAQVPCGPSMVRAALGAYQCLSLAKIAFSLTTDFTHLHMYIRRADANPATTRVLITLLDGTYTARNYVELAPQHCDRFVIDAESWTRVRVPLAEFSGLAGGGLVGGLHVCTAAQAHELLLDEIRLLQAQTDEILVNSTATVYNLVPICSPPPPPPASNAELVSRAAEGDLIVRSGSLGVGGRALFRYVSVAGASVLLSASGAAQADVDLYVSESDAAPSSAAFDAKSDAPGEASESITYTLARGDTLYISVHAPAGANFTLTFDARTPAGALPAKKAASFPVVFVVAAGAGLILLALIGVAVGVMMKRRGARSSAIPAGVKVTTTVATSA